MFKWLRERRKKKLLEQQRQEHTMRKQTLNRHNRRRFRDSVQNEEGLDAAEVVMIAAALSSDSSEASEPSGERFHNEYDDRLLDDQVNSVSNSNEVPEEFFESSRSELESRSSFSDESSSSSSYSSSSYDTGGDCGGCSDD